MIVLIFALLAYGIIATGLGLAAIGFLYADRKRLAEWNSVLKQERDEWRDKATVKQGIGLVGQERKVPPPPANKNPQPKVVSRADLQRRHAEEVARQEDERVENAIPVTTPITTHADNVKAPSRPIVGKVREILNAED
jgi:hypothetical protein